MLTKIGVVQTPVKYIFDLPINVTMTHRRNEQNIMYIPQRKRLGMIQRSFHLGRWTELYHLYLKQSFVLVFPYYFRQDFQSSFDLWSALILLVMRLFSLLIFIFFFFFLKRPNPVERTCLFPLVFSSFLSQLFLFRNHPWQVLSLSLVELPFQCHHICLPGLGIRLAALRGDCSPYLVWGYGFVVFLCFFFFFSSF